MQLFYTFHMFLDRMDQILIAETVVSCCHISNINRSIKLEMKDWTTFNRKQVCNMHTILYLAFKVREMQ